MKRRWVPIKDIQIYDEFHQQDGDSFIVDEERDGNSTEYHKQGIERIKDVLSKGSKILPILVWEDYENHYVLLDGFKRSRAHLELGREYIEAFICATDEYAGAREFKLWGKEGRAWKGGLPYEVFGLFEGAEQEGTNYAGTTFLYNSPRPNGLKIEVSESIHVHWDLCGRYRLSLGRRDFEALAKAISKI